MPPPAEDDDCPEGLDDVLAFLATAEITSGLDDAARRRIAAELHPLALSSGQYLVRQGETGDSLYLLVTGRLGVIAATEAGPTVVGRIDPGAVVGELAVLADTPRLASVVALRDSRLLRLSRAAFDAVAEEHPRLLRAAAATVVQRLGERGHAAPSSDRTVAVIPAATASDAAVVEATVSSLMTSLGRYGTVGVMAWDAGSDDATRAQTLQRHEAESAFVLLTGDGGDDASRWCLRHADAVVLVARATDDLLPGAAERAVADVRVDPLTAPDIYLLLSHVGAAEPTGTGRWLDALGVDSVFHARGDETSRLARFLAGRAVGVALGGGGARGFAHLGVLRALDEAGVAVDAIGGTSIGALVAAFYAMGWTADEREERALEALTRSGPLFGVTLPVLSLSSAARLQRLLTDPRYLGTRRIEDLPLSYCCVSADLGRAETVVHRRGQLASSVRASLSLPGVLPPVASADRWLVDGGVLDNLPVTAVRTRNGGGPLIAVDIRPQIDLSMTPHFGASVSGWSLLRRRYRNAAERLPSLLDILVRSNSLGSIAAQTRSLAAQPAELLLQPPVSTIRILDFRRAPALMQAGYEHTMAALEEADAALWP